MPSLYDFSLFMPEIFLALAAMLMLVVAAFLPKLKPSHVNLLALLAVGCGFFLLLNQSSAHSLAAFGMVASDGFTLVCRGLILLASAGTLLLFAGENRAYAAAGQGHSVAVFETPILILLATIGLMLMVGANDLIALYVALELASLSMYVLAASDSRRASSTEAGIKYFALGALASGFLLFGASLIYGDVGSTGFADIAKATASAPSAMLLMGMVMMVAGLCFKVSAAPFHMWTPDVYEGAPGYVTGFFASAPKVAALALFIRVMFIPFEGVVPHWQPLLIFAAVFSMLAGAVTAIWQSRFKRLMAYSSIGHVGYMLMGLLAHTEEATAGVVLYLSLYVPMSLAVFAIFLSMTRADGTPMQDITELSGLSKTHPWLAFGMMVLMFSMAGIPPFAGFWAKFVLFSAVVDAGFIWLAVVALVASVIAAFYYIRIVKLMYFDVPAEKPVFVDSLEISLLATLGCMVTAGYVLMPQPLLEMSSLAAKALFAM